MLYVVITLDINITAIIINVFVAIFLGNFVFLTIIVMIKAIIKTPNIIPIILNAICSPVATWTNTSVLSVLLFKSFSSICLELSVVPMLETLVIVPTESSVSVLVNVNVSSIDSPGCISLVTIFVFDILYCSVLAHPEFNSEWNSNFEGISSIISYILPANSPSLVTLILYSIAIVEPTNCFEWISTFANFLLSYVYSFVPFLFETVIFWIVWFIEKSKSLFSISPMSILVWLDFKLIISVIATFFISPNILTSFSNVSLFSVSKTPTFWYSVIPYSFELYSNIV